MVIGYIPSTPESPSLSAFLQPLSPLSSEEDLDTYLDEIENQELMHKDNLQHQLTIIELDQYLSTELGPKPGSHTPHDDWFLMFKSRVESWMKTLDIQTGKSLITIANSRKLTKVARSIESIINSLTLDTPIVD